MTARVPRLATGALVTAAAATAVAGLPGCGGGGRDDDDAATIVRRPASPPALCGRLSVRDVGRIEDTEAVELSGLVASRTRRGILWAHNDSGDRPRLFALTTRARVLGSFEVTGAQAQDWEDIATGPAPGSAGGGAVLYPADIGDNDARRDAVVVYRVPEPDPSSGGGATAPAGALTLRYPDGPHDAEALLVDPRRARLAIVTKSLDGEAGVYTTSIPTALPARRTLRRAGAVALGLANPVTAGDVSADGSIVVLRSYSRLFAWNRAPGESLARTLRRSPCASPTALTDPQGEAVALVRAGRVALTVSEGSRPALRRYTPAP